MRDRNSFESLYMDQLHIDHYHNDEQYERAYLGTYGYDLLPEATKKMIGEYADAHNSTMNDQIMLSMIADTLHAHSHGWQLAQVGKVRQLYVLGGGEAPK